MKKLVIHIFVFFILSSCTEKIEFDLDNTSPEIIIEGSISNYFDNHRVTITKSQCYYNFNLPEAVENAEVQIICQQDTFYLFEVSEGVYLTGYIKGIPGNTYTLEVNTDDHIFTAESTMPSEPVIDSIKFESNADESGIFDVLLYTQEPPEDNYYYWGLMKDQNPVTTSLDKLRFANDDLINGNYLSGLKVHAIEAEPESHVTLIMASIPGDYFNYCLSILKETKYSDSPFEPAPANPETNIKGGALGFFHAYSETSMTRIVRSTN
ncbi:MAG: DUF4249 domain-containing protein [Bacteroidetes bacterium]|nr:DUF4249 domain-containing protein [Bacteroidota bacterium]